jgi:hypothetical protein
LLLDVLHENSVVNVSVVPSSWGFAGESAPGVGCPSPLVSMSGGKRGPNMRGAPWAPVETLKGPAIVMVITSGSPRAIVRAPALFAASWSVGLTAV